MRIRKLLGEPLLPFLLLGGALFAIYGWMAPGRDSGNRIVITQGVVDDLVTQYQARSGRPPSAPELSNLIESYVRDEILYYEGLTVGLDRDDLVIKRRVRQKLEVMAEEELSAITPTDAELAAYLAANHARFVEPAIVTFNQIFLGPAGPSVQRAAVAVTRDAVKRGADPSTLGTPTLLPSRVTHTPSDLIARDFGPSFVAALEQLPIGEWTGPVDSAFGTHLVYVRERTPALMPELSQVRASVLREWDNARRLRAREDSYRKLRSQYEVTLDVRTPGGTR